MADNNAFSWADTIAGYVIDYEPGTKTIEL
jgi:hypothetical protein